MEGTFLVLGIQGAVFFIKANSRGTGMTTVNEM